MKKKSQLRRRPQPHNPFLQPLIVLSLIILGVLIWYTIPRQSNLSINQIIEGTGTVDLSLSPATHSIMSNTNLDLKLLANTPESTISSAKLELTYSPGCGVPQVAVGTLLPKITLAPTVENGLINFTFDQDPGSSPNPSLPPLIATITLNNENPGTCQLDFTPNNLVLIEGNQDNQARSLTGSQITITQTSPSLSPSPSPSLSPSPSPQKPQKPTALRSNCFEGGTQITLRWDAVSGATGYNLRLDQIDGSDYQSTDNLTKTEHSYALLPGKKYSWWVHSVRNGLESDKAQIAEVVCRQTSTPTPSPTPIPPKLPTPKPTLKPTPQPTPYTTPAPPSAPPQLSPLPSTSTTNVAPGSLNDIFRDIEELEPSPSSTPKPSFFQMIAIGWQAILQRLANIF